MKKKSKKRKKRLKVIDNNLKMNYQMKMKKNQAQKIFLKERRHDYII